MEYKEGINQNTMKTQFQARLNKSTGAVEYQLHKDVITVTVHAEL